jgi:two-component system LytT family sensor kinase
MYIVYLVFNNQPYIKNRSLAFALSPMLIYLLLMAVLVYGNTLLLIPYLLNRKRIFLYIISLLALMIAYILGASSNNKYWDAIVWPNDPMTLQSYFHWNFIFTVWFTLIATMLFFTQKWYEQRQQVKNIQVSQLETELKYLRAQVNPHFLFNGLNTIYGNIDIKDQRARDVLLQFSDLLRYSLYEADTDLVDIEKEALYLENYVALQRARSNSTLQTELSIQIEDKNLKIAPLIFMAFVENAFKFSTRDDNKINNIKIKLQQSGNRIIFECTNTYESAEQAPGGIGLNNVKRRLELLYKDKHILDIRHDENTWNISLILMV